MKCTTNAQQCNDKITTNTMSDRQHNNHEQGHNKHKPQQNGQQTMYNKRTK